MGGIADGAVGGAADSTAVSTFYRRHRLHFHRSLTPPPPPPIHHHLHHRHPPSAAAAVSPSSAGGMPAGFRPTIPTPHQSQRPAGPEYRSPPHAIWYRAALGAMGNGDERMAEAGTACSGGSSVATCWRRCKEGRLPFARRHGSGTAESWWRGSGVALKAWRWLRR
ncbi:Os12g0204200 [Oryza sativa Japonica Group]|uniref:Os12g0204200 protein n=2 Tax=Oryza sativa subsp. japonica TaxID=39947 RepID=B9EWA9_ORYSJ|nr:hypothetical protein OsJ_01657 [Oryza sativa Japonica Group]BAT16281.1 Os12g0204200 [Oryza sativa Japonica Group]